MHRKGPQGNATQTNENFFEHILFFCKVLVPPRREYGWTKLVRTQADQITSPPKSCSLASFATISDNQISFFTRPKLLWDKTGLSFLLEDGNWDNNYLEMGLGVSLMKPAKFLQGAWIPDRNFLLISAWVVRGKSQASPNRVQKSHYTE